MSTDSDGGRTFPKSMRHKRVLDAAAENPGASIDELASMVPSATAELVERVLEHHGDPAADEGSDAPETAASDQAARTAQADEDGDRPDAEPAESGSGSGSDDGSGANADTGMETEAEAETKVETDTGTDTETETDTDTDTEAEGAAYPSPEELSPKQREVLSIVAAEPAATQSEIGDRLGVTQTTVNARVNSIEGFDWSERRSFVDAVFDGEPAATGGVDRSAADATATDDEAGAATDGSGTEDETGPGETPEDVTAELERIRERVSALEAAGDRDREAAGEGAAFEDPELVHKIVHACLSSEQITESEELRILRTVLDR